MPYCPKCGNKVDETMAFCSACGTPLKGAVASQPARNCEEKQEKHESLQKGEYGFVGYLIGGLILITIGAFTILDLTSNGLASGQELVTMLIIIGFIIIGGALYVVTPTRKFFRQLIIRPKNNSKA